MEKRLVKVAQELHVGTSTIVDYLNGKGFPIENKPTSKVTKEMELLLLKEFQKSMAIKEQADQLTIGVRPPILKREVSSIREEHGTSIFHQQPPPLFKKEEPVDKAPLFKKEEPKPIFKVEPVAKAMKEQADQLTIGVRPILKKEIPVQDTTKGSFNLSSKKSNSNIQGNNYLFSIGINEYTSGFSNLVNAVKDVEDIAALLTARFGFQVQAPFTNFLRNKKATRRNIIHQLEALCETEKHDRVLIFYSGHGYLHPKTKHGFWIPADAERGDVSSYLPNSTLRDYIKAMPCRHVLLISDSCFSGELFARDASRRMDFAIQDWERHQSRWVFCSGKGVVSDGKAGENSPFATQILRFLQEQSPDEPLDIALLANKVTKSVRFNYEQQAEACPLFGAGHDGGQFIFYPQKNEDVAFEKAKASRRKQDLMDFLETFKNVSQKKEIRSILWEVEREEKEIWRQVDKNSYAALDEFLDENPHSSFASKAQQCKSELKALADIIHYKQLEREKSREEENRRALAPFYDLMVHIEGGSFNMGSNELNTEKPIHRVTVKDFYLCKYPVTQAQWKQIMGDIPSHFKGDDLPVEKVSWNDTQAFIKKLNERTGGRYRLPTEAEWEFAARGGVKSKGYKFAGSININEVAWYYDNSAKKTHPVGQKKANELGLHDMSGNVWEWCEDDWHGNYENAPKDGSAWVDAPVRRTERVLRGGGFVSGPQGRKVCSSFRRGHLSEKSLYDLGFRLAKDM